MVVNYLSVVAGQLLAATGDPGGFVLFTLAAIAIGWALIPVGLTRASSPAPLGSVRLRLLHLFRISPVGAVGAMLVGIANGAFATLAPVYVAGLGFSVGETALFVGATVAGAAAMQVPAGWLSDRLDRRIVIGGLSALACALGIWLAVSGRSGLAVVAAETIGVPLPVAWMLAGLVYGAAIYPIYGLCVAHMNDFVTPEGFVEAAGSILLLWSVGAVAGPILAGAAMAVEGSALFLVMAASHALLGLFALWRMTQRAAPPSEEKDSYVPVGLTRMTPASVPLDPRTPEIDEPADPAPRS